MTETLTTIQATPQVLHPTGEMTARPVTRPTESTQQNKSRRPGTLKVAVYLLTFVALAALFAEGYSFYSTPLAERPHHADYRALRPAGSRGLLYGAAGTVAMLLMHLYSLRKRSKRFQQLGPVRIWLDAHIYLGLVGPIFIVLHTSFRIGGLVAVSFWSMVIVALSGIVGRYLYHQIPRNIHGKQLSLQEVEQARDKAVRELNDGLAITSVSDEPEHSALPVDTIPEGLNVISALWFAVRSDMLRPITRRRLQNAYTRELAIPKPQIAELVDLTLAVSTLQRRIMFLDQLRRLFHYWHVMHKPLAYLMYLVMGVHIGVAVWTGYVPGF